MYIYVAVYLSVAAVSFLKPLIRAIVFYVGLNGDTHNEYVATSWQRLETRRAGAHTTAENFRSIKHSHWYQNLPGILNVCKQVADKNV